MLDKSLTKSPKQTSTLIHSVKFWNILERKELATTLHIDRLMYNGQTHMFSFLLIQVLTNCFHFDLIENSKSVSIPSHTVGSSDGQLFIRPTRNACFLKVNEWTLIC